MITKPAVTRMAVEDAEVFCHELLLAAGADDATARAVTRALMHASCVGVDSHGLRLVPHYIRAMEGGRVNPKPALRFLREFGSVATLDADHGHGALAAYTAMDRAVALAATHGIGAVAIRNSSHFGAAGAFARAAAEAGMIGFAFCNSDSFVRLHGGAERFHGTNPIAVGVPSAVEQPWLLDMATSAIPYNRVQLYRSLGTALPAGTASTAEGVDTTDADQADMLAPLGGEFGFKGAGLAGLSEILSAVITGMRLSSEILPMPGPDFATPRELGAFVIAISPEAFGEREAFEAGMRRYLTALRGSRAAAGATVMAPGEREWAEAEARAEAGVPLDPDTMEAFAALSERLGVALPAARQPG